MPVATPAAFRSRFPLLAGTVHLASCSLGPPSDALGEAMDRMGRWLTDAVLPWELWMAEVEQARERFARLINAAPHEVAVIPSATVGAYQVAATTDWSARPGLVGTTSDYPSVAQVWLAQRPRGAAVDYVREGDGGVPPSHYLDRIDERTALVSIPLVSYVTGGRMPVREVVTAAHEVGARVFVDAYQAAGVLPIDVRELGCDYLVSGAMKYLLGLPGIAFLYVRDGVKDDLPPQLTGWYGRSNPLAFDPSALDFPDDARRFQVAMPTFPAALAANAGLQLLEGLDIAAVDAHVDRLVTYAIGRLGEIGARLQSPIADGVRGPQIAVQDDAPRMTAAWLEARRIFLARGNVLRFSFHYFNDESDVDAACRALGEYRSVPDRT